MEGRRVENFTGNLAYFSEFAVRLPNEAFGLLVILKNGFSTLGFVFEDVVVSEGFHFLKFNLFTAQDLLVEYLGDR